MSCTSEPSLDPRRIKILRKGENGGDRAGQAQAHLVCGLSSGSSRSWWMRTMKCDSTKLSIAAIVNE